MTRLAEIHAYSSEHMQGNSHIAAQVEIKYLHINYKIVLQTYMV